MATSTRVKNFGKNLNEFRPEYMWEHNEKAKKLWSGNRLNALISASDESETENICLLLSINLSYSVLASSGLWPFFIQAYESDFAINFCLVVS